MPDAYSQWEEKTRREEAWLAKRPVCCHCGHHIQEENLYDVEGSFFHEECMNERFRKYTEDYIA